MSTPVLIATHVAAGYQPGLPIVKDVSVSVSAGEVVTIVGPNGAGKSTFLKALAGLVMFEGGTVLHRGVDVSGRPAHDLARAGLGFVPQTANIFTDLSVQDNLVLGGHMLSRALLKQRMAEALAHFPVLRDKRSVAGRVLSGGQRQMLAVARALMTAPDILMLDEPTAGLAPRVVAEMFAEIRRLAATGVAVLMVEQNAKAALAASDRGYVLVDGYNSLSGEAQDLLAHPDLHAAFLGQRRVA